MKKKTEQTERLLRLMTECDDGLQKEANDTDSREKMQKTAGKSGKARKAILAVLIAAVLAAAIGGGVWSYRYFGQTVPGEAGTESGTEEGVLTEEPDENDSVNVEYGPKTPANPVTLSLADGKTVRLVSLEELNGTPVQKISAGMTLSDFDRRFSEYASRNASGNYTVSPLSFRYALGLLLSGASGTTEKELLAALGVQSAEEWNEYCARCNGIMQRFEAARSGNDGESAFRVANSVWKNSEMLLPDFRQAYVRTVTGYYGAEYAAFTPDTAVKDINLWAKTKTNGLIDPLVPENFATDDLAVVLMNALYFKDAWTKPFAKRTRSDDFTTETGKKVTKDFMTVKDKFAYYADAQTQLVILPMKNGVNMAVVLGDTADIGQKISAAQKTEARVSVPKMDFESEFENLLPDFLKDSGVNLAFDRLNADFSGMMELADGSRLYVGKIIQKTKFKADTDGVEAAAATVIQVPTATGPMEPEKEFVEFTADRPFSFYIYSTADDVTALLFAGEMVE